MSTPRRRVRLATLPLSVWIAGGVAATAVMVLAVIGAVLAQDGLDSMDLGALGAGLLVGVIAVVGAAQWSRRVTFGLRTLHSDAMRRLRDPSAARPEQSRLDDVLVSSEIADLARVLDALQLRARVADEVAEQARRSAESAGAGMFELLSGLVAAEEATRGQLSAELHDTVAQSLMAARSMLADRAAMLSEDRARVREYVEDAEEQVRAVMARTRPPELRDGDLASAVGSLRRDMAARYLLDVRITWPEEPYPLPLASAVTIYRFFQEALLNVIKHADVDIADVGLAVEDQMAVATVKDHGPGFDPAQDHSEAGRHVGLGLLRERARLAGGSLQIQSQPGLGAELTLRLPLAPAGATGMIRRGGGVARRGPALA